MSQKKNRKSRREFIQVGAKAGALVYLLGNPIFSTGKKISNRSKRGFVKEHLD